jgi:hypothetical protein
VPRKAAHLIAIAATLLGVGCCGVATLMLLSLGSGVYAPLSDDGVSVEQAASVPMRLKIIAVVSLAAASAGAAWLWQNRKPT